MYKRIYVCSLEELQEVHEIGVDNSEQLLEKMDEQSIVDKFSGLKRKVVRDVLDGYNWHEISIKHKKNKNVIYAIKEELKDDMSWVFNDSVKNKYIDENRGKLNDLSKILQVQSMDMKLAEFANIYINDYNPEAKFKNWQEIPLQDIYFDIWETHPKSCTKAPREHLKTTSVCEYLVKKIFERKYPLDIVYLHGSRDIAIEKLRDIQGMAERNPILSAGFMIDKAKNWKDGEMRLLDGTSIYANSFGTSLVGRHPHIIVLDDIIDQKVIYSDQLNQKAIRKFFSDVYPMITDVGEDKKIIIIGTAQREDDLYQSLPEDFHSETYRAFIDQDETIPLEPVLFSAEKLNKVKRDISEKHGESFWLKEYMNMPFTAMGEIIKPEWIKTYTTLPPDLDVFQGWDLGVGKDINSGDYTAGATIGIRKIEDKLEIYVIDIVKQRLEFGDRLKVMTANGKRHSAMAIGVEQNVFQYDTVITLKKQTNLPIQGIKTVKNKIEKFQVDLAPHFENGKVFISADMIDLKNELLSLPYGKHDDQCDALCLAILVSNQFVGEPIIDFL